MKMRELIDSTTVANVDLPLYLQDQYGNLIQIDSVQVRAGGGLGNNPVWVLGAQQPPEDLPNVDATWIVISVRGNSPAVKEDEHEECECAECSGNCQHADDCRCHDDCIDTDDFEQVKEYVENGDLCVHSDENCECFKHQEGPQILLA